MNTRLEWTIEQKALWIATHESGTTLVARTETSLMRKINAWEKAELAG